MPRNTTGSALGALLGTLVGGGVRARQNAKQVNRYRDLTNQTLPQGHQMDIPDRRMMWFQDPKVEMQLMKQYGDIARQQAQTQEIQDLMQQDYNQQLQSTQRQGIDPDRRLEIYRRTMGLPQENPVPQVGPTAPPIQGGVATSQPMPQQGPSYLTPEQMFKVIGAQQTGQLRDVQKQRAEDYRTRTQDYGERTSLMKRRDARQAKMDELRAKKIDQQINMLKMQLKYRPQLYAANIQALAKAYSLPKNVIELMIRDNMTYSEMVDRLKPPKEEDSFFPDLGASPPMESTGDPQADAYLGIGR